VSSEGPGTPIEVLRVEGLEVAFSRYGKGWSRDRLKVISNLNLTVRSGEIVAVAGSSGSGKSLLAHAVLGILPRNAHTSGRINFMGKALTPARLKKLRGTRIAFVPQSVEYLDPLMRVGRQISPDRQAVLAAFERYRLDPSVAELYPHQLSGGMARRVLVASAVVGDPQLIVADEPTPGMSKELADKAMKHFRDLADAGVAVLLITHDIDLALGYADRVAVFYAGTTVETAPADDFDARERLRHPWSQALWQAIPANGFQPTPGHQPYAGRLPQGCLYAPRCPRKGHDCGHHAPPTVTIRGGEVSCCYAS
jgi:peptide/nickel transport system ATP-binding protein